MPWAPPVIMATRSCGLIDQVSLGLIVAGGARIGEDQDCPNGQAGGDSPEARGVGMGGVAEPAHGVGAAEGADCANGVDDGDGGSGGFAGEAAGGEAPEDG